MSIPFELCFWHNKVRSVAWSCSLEVYFALDVLAVAGESSLSDCITQGQLACTISVQLCKVEEQGVDWRENSSVVD